MNLMMTIGAVGMVKHSLPDLTKHLNQHLHIDSQGRKKWEFRHSSYTFSYRWPVWDGELAKSMVTDRGREHLPFVSCYRRDNLFHWWCSTENTYSPKGRINHDTPINKLSLWSC